MESFQPYEYGEARGSADARALRPPSGGFAALIAAVGSCFRTSHAVNPNKRHHIYRYVYQDRKRARTGTENDGLVNLFTRLMLRSEVKKN